MVHTLLFMHRLCMRRQNSVKPVLFWNRSELRVYQAQVYLISSGTNRPVKNIQTHGLAALKKKQNLQRDGECTVHSGSKCDEQTTAEMSFFKDEAFFVFAFRNIFFSSVQARNFKLNQKNSCESILDHPKHRNKLRRQNFLLSETQV